MRRGIDPMTAALALLLPLWSGTERLAAQEPAAAPGQAAAAVGPNLALTPGDFLDNVGKQAKARWRQLYRAAPPAAGRP